MKRQAREDLHTGKTTCTYATLDQLMYRVDPVVVFDGLVV